MIDEGAKFVAEIFFFGMPQDCRMCVLVNSSSQSSRWNEQKLKKALKARVWHRIFMANPQMNKGLAMNMRGITRAWTDSIY